jgi:RNA polymerase-binding transcription factor DksA
MDDIERAQERQLVDNEVALLEHEARTTAGPQLIDADTGAVLCWQCNEPIPPARLAAQPYAGYCIECQADLEARQKRGKS